jgi:hypothetical protein
MMLFREELLQALEEQLERKLSIELYSSDGRTSKCLCNCVAEPQSVVSQFGRKWQQL